MAMKIDGQLDLDGNRVINAGAPVAGTDLATRSWVEGAISNAHIPLSDTAPEALATTASAGDDMLAARGDHVHSTTGLVTTAAHTKALHDALGINAATLVGNTPANLLARANHTGTQALSTITGHDKAAHDALNINADTVDGQHATALLARANHTGTQAAATISDFAEAVEDAVGAMTTGNTETGITVVYDDVAAKLNFAVTDSPTVAGQAPADLRARASHTGTQALSTITGHDKAAHDALNINASTVGGNTPATLLARGNHTGTQLASTISDFNEAAQDSAGALFTDNTSTGITSTYDDAAGKVHLVVTNAPTVGGLTTAQLLARASHTGTQALSTITGHDKAAHDALGIDAGLLGGQTLAQVRARASHTGTQPLSTITGHDKAAHDALNIDAATLNGQSAAQLQTTITTAIVGAAPGTLDTLNEIAAALQNNPAVISDLLTGLSQRNRTFAVNIGNGTATDYVVTHNLNTRDVTVQLYEVATPYAQVWASVERTSVNTVTVKLGSPAATNKYRVVVQGS